ncbi:MAG: metalloregulator ArsR/SmtB family transcription factor [Phycisphaerae bacterium]|nr:metalloregulator ArsR/SmtB family transcription factor [Phycisphaerae bacterium]
MPASDPTARERWLSWLGSLGDLARLRLLRLLQSDELGVGELARALQLPQSTVSRHLKPLFEQGWVVKRTEGTQSLYRLVPEQLPADMRALWQLSLDHLGTSHTFDEDDARLAEVLALRRVDSRTFFGRIGGDWDDLRRQLFGEAFGADALLALLPPNAVVADLGCGTGDASVRLAPFVERIIAIDREPSMLAAAKRRLAQFKNIEFRQGDIFQLPLKPGEVNLVVMMLVLHHLDGPERALEGVARALSADGRALVVDMVSHDRSSYQHTMGHRHLGFSESDLRGLAKQAGLRLVRYTRLRPDTEGKGPGLFSALLMAAPAPVPAPAKGRPRHA